MTVLSMRYCATCDAEQARGDAGFFDALGLPRMQLPPEVVDYTADAAFGGAIFLAGASWIELWAASDKMQPGVMLQIVVDDADAYAARAKAQGLDPQGPMEFLGEKIWFFTAPSGMPVSVQSAIRSE